MGLPSRRFHMQRGVLLFSQSILDHKYAMTSQEREKLSLGSIEAEHETWEDIAERTGREVASPYLDPEVVEEIVQLIKDRKFIPGGRYLYAAGRKFHQINNCLLLDVEDSREGWSNLARRTTSALMTGAGIGAVYSKLREKGAHIGGLGGKSTGPVSLMSMINEIGRNVMQGGSRRSAIWAGLHWNHPDIFEFIHAKDWPDVVREQKEHDFNFPAPLDMTNISVILDDDFFVALEGDAYPEDVQWAREVWERVTHRMCKTGEPGLSIDVGENSGEHLRNAPVHGDTHVLTSGGYKQIRDIEGTPTEIWTGEQWATDVVFKQTGENEPTVTVNFTGGRKLRCEPWHEFLVERYEGAGTHRHLVSVDPVQAQDLRKGETLHVSLPEADVEKFDSMAYTLGWVYGDGSFGDRNAELTLCSLESKECFDYMVGYSTVTMRDSRGFTRLYFSTDNEQWGDRQKNIFPEDGDSQSFLAGLFDADGNVLEEQHRIRLSSVHKEFLEGVQRSLESYGILSHISKGGISTYGQNQQWQLVVTSESVHEFHRLIPTQRLDTDFGEYESYRPSQVKVQYVEEDEPADTYCADVGVPEHSFQAEGVVISNCTEVVSSDDNEVCNLGSVNLSKIDNVAELSRVTELATAFLMCGTLYSDLPYDEVYETRSKNRRLGLGLMGLHEWLLQRGYSYQPNKKLEDWLGVWKDVSNSAAKTYAQNLGVSTPVKVRAIAPTGTIAIIGETTAGIEPVFCAAYKRRYLKDTTWYSQYVVDYAVRRMLDNGVPSESIEDAYNISVDQRIEFQAFVQQFVDNAISSTINMSEWGSESNNPDTINDFRKSLRSYLPYLRGITVYPDGGRGGQPITKVDLETALSHEGVEFEELSNTQSCKEGACGV